MPESYREITRSIIETVYKFDKGSGVCAFTFPTCNCKIKMRHSLFIVDIKGRNATTCIGSKLFDGENMPMQKYHGGIEICPVFRE